MRAGQTLGRIGLTTHFFRWLGPETLQRSHACGHVWQGPSACPNRVRANRLEAGKVAGFLTCRIPYAGLALVQANARMAPQRVFQGPVQFPGAFRCRHDVRVVQKSKDCFTFSESGCGFAQGRMLREGIERWHKRIALFASFAFSMAWRDT